MKKKKVKIYMKKNKRMSKEQWEKEYYIGNLSFIEMCDEVTIRRLLILVAMGYNVNLTKLRILDWFSINPQTSLNAVSKAYGIDYKNVYRIFKELKEAGIIVNENVSQGKKGKIRFKKEPSKK